MPDAAPVKLLRSSELLRAWPGRMEEPRGGGGGGETSCFSLEAGRLTGPASSLSLKKTHKITGHATQFDSKSIKRLILLARRPTIVAADR